MSQLKNDLQARLLRTPDEIWERIMDAATAVCAAYNALLAASDDLAEEMYMQNGCVLKNVMPKAIRHQRDAERILEWVAGEKANALIFNENRKVRILEWLKADEERQRQEDAERERGEKVAALLARLNLSPEERELLDL